MQPIFYAIQVGIYPSKSLKNGGVTRITQLINRGVRVRHSYCDQRHRDWNLDIGSCANQETCKYIVISNMCQIEAPDFMGVILS